MCFYYLGLQLLLLTRYLPTLQPEVNRLIYWITDCHDRVSRSPTSLRNGAAAADSAASGRYDVTSGHVTRRSQSAKTAASATRATGRRCKSSDDRRRQKCSPSADPPEPFHRRCCCPTRNAQGHGQGHQVTSEGQAGSSSRSSDRRPPDAVCRPWARTLRDYGDKSPSPVRSRRSTPESANCRRTATRSTKTGSEVISDVGCHRPVPSWRTNRPIPADLGTTKSDSTLVRQRVEMKIGSSGSAMIPPSSSLGAVTQRRTSNYTDSSDTRGVARQTPTSSSSSSSSCACREMDRGCLHGLPPRTAVLSSSPASEQTSIHCRLEVCYSTVRSHVVLGLPARRFRFPE